MPGPVNKKRKRTRERKKYCRCTPHCNKKLLRQARRAHHRALSPSQLDDARDSDSATESVSDDLELLIPSADDSEPTQKFPPEDTAQVLSPSSQSDRYGGSDQNLGGVDGQGYEGCGEEEGSPSIHSEYESDPLHGSDVTDALNNADDCSAKLDNSFSSEGSLEKDEWMDFNEEDEGMAELSEEEMTRELETMLGEEEFAQLWDKRNDDLTEQDEDNIRAFKIRMVSNMPRAAFDQMRHAFRHKLDISSHYVIIHRLAILSGITPQWVDCCVNSCIAYTAKYKNHAQCPTCSEKRHSERTGKARRLFCYIPLIPRLKMFFSNPKTIEELSYRHGYSVSDHTISDVFDSEHYRNLRKTKVSVDGINLPHKYFSGKHDIAFGVCLDGYLLYKRRRGGPSATPILLQIYNLPPEIRTLLGRSMCLGVIPGPKGPKDIGSFLEPFETECVSLAKGVKTFDCIARKYFQLHAYHLFPLGDIIAIEKFLNIKGHNGKCPCRSCEIKAINNSESTDKTYYVPLAHPRKPGEPQKQWDPTNLPLRQHKSWKSVTEKLNNTVFAVDRDALAMHYGIKGMPALQRVGSIDYARGVPWDFMHLLFENVVKNLVHLWMGKFKGLDTGSEDYEIPPHIWKVIGEETAAATRYIPAAFVRPLANIAEDQTYFTAEGWAFWFMYLAPILLRNRFSKEKYYQHMCDLANIMKACIQFSITHAEINDLEEKIITWVKQYEKIYYQYSAERLSTCTLTIHGLLHICDNIRFCGPIWTTWTFWMERYCGYLQAGLRSRSHPWANLNNRVLHKAYLEQIDIYYDLQDDIQITSEDLHRGEKLVEGYPLSVLRLPCKKGFNPDNTIKSKIARYLSVVINKTAPAVHKNLPHVMPSWGKVRVANGGDCIRASSACHNEDKERNMSYVRYEVEVTDGRSHEQVREIFYGKMDLILECAIPDTDFWGCELRGKTLLLAVITPCVTNGFDATKQVVSYNATTTQIVTDLRVVNCVVGRVKTREKWGIIDRSGDFSRTEFVPSNMEPSSIHYDDEDG